MISCTKKITTRFSSCLKYAADRSCSSLMSDTRLCLIEDRQRIGHTIFSAT